MPDTPFFDEEKFRRALPFEVRPTATPGVYETPPPGPDFDPRNATAEELRRAGLPFRRSAIQRNPVLRALWDRLTARPFTRVDAGQAKTRVERRGRRLPNEGGGYNTWAGPVDESQTYTGVVGTWVIPTVSVPRGLPAGSDGWRVSTWVGLDGVVPLGSNNCIQTGVAQQIKPDGTIEAPEPWYEWWMSNPPSNAPPFVNITQISGLDVKPGDTVSALVAFSGGAAGFVSLFNESKNKYFSLVLPTPTGVNMPGSSAEWIAEVPGGGLPYYQLPAFTPVTFTGAIACNCDNLNDPTFSDPTTSYVVEIPTSSTNSTVLTSTTTGANTTTISFIG